MDQPLPTSHQAKLGTQPPPHTHTHTEEAGKHLFLWAQKKGSCTVCNGAPLWSPNHLVLLPTLRHTHPLLSADSPTLPPGCPGLGSSPAGSAPTSEGQPPVRLLHGSRLHSPFPVSPLGEQAFFLVTVPFWERSSRHGTPRAVLGLPQSKMSWGDFVNALAVMVSESEQVE